MTLEHVNPDTLFKLDGFSQVTIAPASRRIAHIAGQTALNSSLELEVEGFHDQVVAAFRNVARALEAIGATPADVLSQTYFVVDLDDTRYPEFVAAMNIALDGKPFPPNASSLIGVKALALPDLMIEIATVASVP